ncbi:MAG: hypothetical protein KAH21_09285, partial [Spirochaetaceae bacterium]|nr:hypothetical protein [Spirochaetaceae bacterium]
MKLRLIIPYFLMVLPLFSQNPTSEPVSAGDRWTITTRWDYRVRENGRYIGYANRELREVFQKHEEMPAGWIVDVDARLLGATKKDGYPVAARLEDSESS